MKWENTPAEAIARAMEKADRMQRVLIIYVADQTDESEVTGIIADKGVELRDAIYMMESARFDIMHQAKEA